MKLPFPDCRECMAHVRELHAQFGLGAPTAFFAVGLKHGVSAEECFQGYMRMNHALGHPTEEQSNAILPALEQLLNASCKCEADPPAPPKREPHQYEATALGFCSHGALLGSAAFCGRRPKDKVHSILCPQCERRTWVPKDIREGYCTHCQAFTADRS